MRAVSLPRSPTPRSTDTGSFRTHSRAPEPHVRHHAPRPRPDLGRRGPARRCGRGHGRGGPPFAVETLRARPVRLPAGTFRSGEPEHLRPGHDVRLSVLWSSAPGRTGPLPVLRAAVARPLRYRRVRRPGRVRGAERGSALGGRALRDLGGRGRRGGHPELLLEEPPDLLGLRRGDAELLGEVAGRGEFERRALRLGVDEAESRRR